MTAAQKALIPHIYVQALLKKMWCIYFYRPLNPRGRVEGAEKWLKDCEHAELFISGLFSISSLLFWCWGIRNESLIHLDGKSMVATPDIWWY